MAFAVGRPSAASWRALLLALAVAAASALSSASSALAVHGFWVENKTMAPAQEEGGSSWSNLRATVAYGFDWVATGAHVPGGWTLYGGYIIAYQHACHSYAAGNTLGPMMQNASLSSQVMSGGFSTEGTC